MDYTLDTIKSEDGKNRVRVEVDNDARMFDWFNGEFVEWRDLDRWFAKTFPSPEYARETIESGGVARENAGAFWSEGPENRDGKVFLLYKSRQEAKEYGPGHYETARLVMDGEVYGLIYERKCECCGQWESTDSCWGFLGHAYALKTAADWIATPQEHTGTAKA